MPPAGPPAACRAHWQGRAARAPGEIRAYKLCRTGRAAASGAMYGNNRVAAGVGRPARRPMPGPAPALPCLILSNPLAVFRPALAAGWC
ncbi:hypothetical protein CBM2586_B130717 [Cupriavidus phytorum]|uniref:Uncharacterized protein n=1 Tax=Cupriavidus taiwanensis TaxID=164546 RepID=A0A375CK30_9BURK|nr:hypothetical protein CBM2586_B130717 [Cupriavidus taiwanensis]